MAFELRSRGLEVKAQVPVAIEYQKKRFQEGFRADLLIEDKVIIELKCVEKLRSVHKKQLLTYLRLSNKSLGFLLNFSESMMRDGITRTVNGLVSE